MTPELLIDGESNAISAAIKRKDVGFMLKGHSCGQYGSSVPRSIARSDENMRKSERPVIELL